MKFKDIKIGTKFKHCGTYWLKRSTRTAADDMGRIHFFKQKEKIKPNLFVNESYYGA